MKRKLSRIGSGRVAVAVVAVAASCLIAACGSASSSSSSTSSTTASASASGSSSSSAAGGAAGSARRAELVACLKSHGVTLAGAAAGQRAASGSAAPAVARVAAGAVAGPAPALPRLRGVASSSAAAALANISPKMQAAFKACGAQFGFGRGAGGGGFRGRISHTDDHEVRDVRAPARLQPAEPELLGQGADLPGEHPVEREVPGRQQGVPEPADPTAAERGNKYDIGGLRSRELMMKIKLPSSIRTPEGAVGTGGTSRAVEPVDPGARRRAGPVQRGRARAAVIGQVLPMYFVGDESHSMAGDRSRPSTRA